MASGRSEEIAFLTVRSCNLPRIKKQCEKEAKVSLFSCKGRARTFYLCGTFLLLVAGSSGTGYCKQSAIQYVTVSGKAGNSGTSWDSAKSTIADAYAALPPCWAAGKSWNHCGDIEVGGGKFVFSLPIDILSPFVWIRGRGTAVTTLKYTGQTGCAISWTSDPLNDGSGDSYAGGLFDLTLTAPGALAGSSPWPLAFNNSSSPNLSAVLGGACGLETRDIEGFQMRDVEITGFTSGPCWWDHAAQYWNERFKVSAELAGCAVGWFIEDDVTAAGYPGTTFGYGNFNLWINPDAPGQIGVLQAAGVLEFSTVHLIENTAGHTAAFALTNSARWDSDLINFHFEGPGSSTGFYLDSGTVFQGVGPVNSTLASAINGTFGVTPSPE